MNTRDTCSRKTRSPIFSRSKAFRIAVAFYVGAFAAQSLDAAQADPAKDYPAKPVRFIVPVSAGGGSDMVARSIAKKLSDVWGRPVVVDNRTGAAGAIALEITAMAIPDGYTITLISAANAVNSAINPKLPYDLEKDMQGITQVISLFYVMSLSPAVPATSVNELIAYAKANPGKLNYGSTGIGSLQHMAGQMFAHLAGVKITHVPYRGAPSVFVAMVAGEVQISFSTMLALRPHLASGRLRALAISAKQRSPAMPELPTVAEAGVPGYEIDQWFGVVTGAKVPRVIVRKLSAAIGEAVKLPDIVQQFTLDGASAVSSSPEQFSALIKSAIARYRKLAEEVGLIAH